MRDYAASARDRLKALAKTRDEEFQSILLRYATERFLYRLSVSEHRDRCLLKGASLIAVWMDEPYRTTRDLDLLARGPIDEASVARLVATVCAIPCLEDGIAFDLGSILIEGIREDVEYVGQRAKFNAYLGHARIRMQIDIGSGDAVEPAEGIYPVILPGLEAPRLRVYPREYVIAEKFEAMLTLGRRTSRMKDFHDIWALSRGFPFELPKLASAVAACLDRRRMSFQDELPDALGPAFYEDRLLNRQWNDYRAAGSFRGTPPPAAFPDIGSTLVDFLSPVRQAIMTNEVPNKAWLPGGPWK